MTSRAANEPTNADTGFDPCPVHVRIKISALWTAMLFVFAYVDLFSLYRADFRADIESGTIAGFPIGETFLLATTIYVVIPSLMVFASLALPPGIARVASLILSGVYALTIVAGAVGEWSYYLLGSAVEVALLAMIARYAWRWPRRSSAPVAGVQEGALPPLATPSR